MGGWVEVETRDGNELRGNYNWNMDPYSTTKLLSIQDIPITLYSSHVVKNTFNGGSIQRKNFPRIIEMLEKASGYLPSVSETLIAGQSWDNHLMDRIPALEKIIGRQNAGRQFTPADPMVIIGKYSPEFIKRKTKIKISFFGEDIDPNNGFKVSVDLSSDSNIELVEEVDEIVFEKVFLQAFRILLHRAKG